MIPAGIIEDIKNRCDIESVIAPYVTLKRAGNNLKGLCPFHSEKTPSFTVYPGTQSYYCFGCGAGGDAVNFLMRTENLDYVSALQVLAKKAGITLPDFDSLGSTERGVGRSRILAMNLEAAKQYRSILFDERLGAPGRQYLNERGLSMAAVKRFGLGYAPESGAVMTKYLKSLGFTEEEIKTGYLGGSGDYGVYDYYRARVMFPIIDVSGNVIAFGGRIIDSSKSDRKYLNTSDTPAFKKTKNLYALNYAKNSDAGYFILCEGYMDVIALHAAGFGSAVASLGTAFTEEQARIIAKYVKKTVLCYDSDEAGQKATAKAIGYLESVGVEAKILSMTGAKDPDEYIKKFGAEKFRALLEGSRSKFDFMLDGVRKKYNIGESAEKVRALGEVCSFIADVPSSVEREIYIARASEEFSIASEAIKRDTEAKRKRISAENEKKRRSDLIRETSGLSDRVNPDFAKHPKAAKLEEDILGMVFIHHEYLTRQVDGRALTAGDFSTDYASRLFAFISEADAGGGFSVGQLNEAFTTDEVARAARMMAQRSELGANGEDTFDACVRALRDETARNASDGGDSLEALLERKRREQGFAE